MSGHRLIARAFCVAAGASDAGTGALLVGVPGFVLAVLYAEYVFLRMAKVWETRRGRRPGEGD